MDADDDRPNVTPMPAWKRGLAKPRAERLDYDLAFESVCRRLNIEEYLLRAAKEDRRGFLKLFARKIPQQISAQVDHAITVKIVKQVGEKEVVLSIKGSQDARTGEKLPVVPATITQSAIEAATDEDDG